MLQDGPVETARGEFRILHPRELLFVLAECLAAQVCIRLGELECVKVRLGALFDRWKASLPLKDRLFEGESLEAGLIVVVLDGVALRVWPLAVRFQLFSGVHLEVGWLGDGQVTRAWVYGLFVWRSQLEIALDLQAERLVLLILFMSSVLVWLLLIFIIIHVLQPNLMLLLLLLQSHPFRRLKLKRFLDGQLADLLSVTISLVFFVVAHHEQLLFEDVCDWRSHFAHWGDLHVEGRDLVHELVLVCSRFRVNIVIFQYFMDLVILLK